MGEDEKGGNMSVMNDMLEIQKEVKSLRQQLAERDAEVKLLRDALEKVADNNGAYGPFPEANNPLWGPMALVTAREALAATEPKP